MRLKWEMPLPALSLPRSPLFCTLCWIFSQTEFPSLCESEAFASDNSNHIQDAWRLVGSSSPPEHWRRMCSCWVSSHWRPTVWHSQTQFIWIASRSEIWSLSRSFGTRFVLLSVSWQMDSASCGSSQFPWHYFSCIRVIAQSELTVSDSLIIISICTRPSILFSLPGHVLRHFCVFGLCLY